jgi:hypothetical protein
LLSKFKCTKFKTGQSCLGLGKGFLIESIGVLAIKGCFGLVDFSVRGREGQASPVSGYDFMVRSFANSQM